jgi:hypothetical protein
VPFVCIGQLVDFMMGILWVFYRSQARLLSRGLHGQAVWEEGMNQRQQNSGGHYGRIKTKNPEGIAFGVFDMKSAERAVTFWLPSTDLNRGPID